MHKWLWNICQQFWYRRTNALFAPRGINFLNEGEILHIRDDLLMQQIHTSPLSSSSWFWSISFALLAFKYQNITKIRWKQSHDISFLICKEIFYCFFHVNFLPSRLLSHYANQPMSSSDCHHRQINKKEVYIFHFLSVYLNPNFLRLVSFFQKLLNCLQSAASSDRANRAIMNICWTPLHSLRWMLATISLSLQAYSTFLSNKVSQRK